MNLNDLLTKQGIDPRQVLVLRHRPIEPKLRRILPWLAAEKHNVFNVYQQTQTKNLERTMQKLVGSGHVAGFIGMEPGKAVFVGLYSIAGSKPLNQEQFWRIAEHRELRALGLGGWNKSRKFVLRFDLVPQEFYARWKGKLSIVWPPPEMSPEAAGGEVIGASRYELYPPGAEVEVTAMHNDGYVFDYWEFGGVQYNSGPVFTVTLNDDESLLASFSRGKVIGTQVYPEYTGKVEYDPDYPGGIDQNGTRTETYSEGATVSITAVPELGYAFDYWQELVTEKSGEVTYNTDPVMTLVAEEDVSYEASFVSGYIVSATAYPDLNSGTIEYNPDYPGGETEENTIRESFKPGTAMTLSAVPTAGNAFDHWEIDSENVGTSPYYESLLESDIDITAVFTPGKTLTMTVSPGEQAGAVEVDPDLPGGAQNGAVRTECYLTDSSVTVTAAPEVGYLFDHWEGDDIHNSTNDTETLTLSADKAITAYFIEGKVLTVEIVGEGEVNPEEGQHTYATNTVVTGITATPADGWWFDHWEVDLSGSASPTSITLDADKTIRAVFKTNFTLTMAVSGSGTVTPAAGPHTAYFGTGRPSDTAQRGQ